MRLVSYSQVTRIPYFHKGSYFILFLRLQDVSIFKSTAQLSRDKKVMHSTLDKQDGVLKEQAPEPGVVLRSAVD